MGIRWKDRDLRWLYAVQLLLPGNQRRGNRAFRRDNPAWAGGHENRILLNAHVKSHSITRKLIAYFVISKIVMYKLSVVVGVFSYINRGIIWNRYWKLWGNYKKMYVEVKLYRHNLFNKWRNWDYDSVQVDRESPQSQCLCWFADFVFGSVSSLILNIQKSHVYVCSSRLLFM